MEEQRVWVIVDITSPRHEFARLGEGYRVNAPFVLREVADALRAPASALFRHGDGHAVFRIAGARARLTPVRTGLQGAGWVQLIEGLDPGDRLILHPEREMEHAPGCVPARLEKPARKAYYPRSIPSGHFMIKVGIVGATGYTGAELLRLLAVHPHARVTAVTSRQETGTPLATLFPQLRGILDLAFTAPDADTLAQCDLVFFATPHATAMHLVPQLLARGVRAIDLSPDFRLRDPAAFRRWYGHEHAAPALLEEAVYGLPERHRDAIRGARLVANPGCYPTAVQLGWMPLLRAGVVDSGSLIADCKSGVSGAGRELKLGSLFSEAADSFKAYGADGHRHWPEIEQGLADDAGRPVHATFVPHLVPMLRGIHATLYARLAGDADVQALFEQTYADEPFVDVLPPGSHPETRSVRGSNRCQIAVHRPHGGDVVVVLSVIDNLVKGAAGQAVQNMNLIFGFEEAAGLCAPALWP